MRYAYCVLQFFNPGQARPFPHCAEFIAGPAHRVRPLAGPMAGSGWPRWLHAGYKSPA
jgi:hypothetical protein